MFWERGDIHMLAGEQKKKKKICAKSVRFGPSHSWQGGNAQ